MTTTATKTFNVYVGNGYGYPYEATIVAASVAEARKEWKKRGDWKTNDFKVSLVKEA